MSEEDDVAIRRGALPADHFTIISNAWMRDARLSWKAKGLLAYIAGHAPGHELSSEQIIAEGDDGRDAVRAGLRELEAAGYLVRRQRRGAGGLVVGTDFELTDPRDGFSVAGKPVPGPDQQERDVSAGQSSDGFSGDGESASKKNTSLEDQKKTPSSTRRGTRLPADWTPSAELIAWTRENAPSVGWPEVEKFRDYWTAQPGQKGVKLDWDATWRNWARRTPEYAGSRPPVSGKRNGMQEQAARTDLIKQATATVVASGGSADDTAAVLAELARLEAVKSGVSGELAQSPVETCLPMPYIDGEIVEPSGTGGDPQ
jgi:hypothetical protein